MHTVRDKLIAALRGGGHPAGVALAVGLGLFAGFASGVNLTFAAIVWLAIVINVRTSIFLTTWAIGLALAVGGHSICHGAGFALLDELRLGELIGMLGESPIIALLDWDRYALVGGLAIAMVLAVPAARGAWTVSDARWRARHDTKPPHRSYLRPLAWLHAPIAAVPLVFIPWVLVERQLADEILQEGVMFADCRATAERTELCLLTGAWQAENVTVVHRDRPEAPVLRVEQAQAKLNASRLLRGWLHVGELHLRGVTRYESTAPAAEAPTNESAPGAFELHNHLVGWCERRDLLAWSSDALGLFDRLARLDQQRSHPAQEHFFGGLVSTPDEPRSRLGRRQPRVQVTSIQLTELSPTWHLGAKASIEIEQLNSNPRLAAWPTKVRVVAPEWTSEAVVTLQLHDVAQRHQLKIQATDLPLAELLDPARTRSRLVVHRGLVSASGEGWIDVQRVYLPLTLESQQLSAQVLAAQGIAGIDSDQWNRCLRELGGLRADALLHGRWHDLRLSVETQAALQQLKHQLRSAGAHDLLASLDDDRQQRREQFTATPAVSHLPVDPASGPTITPTTGLLPSIPSSGKDLSSVEPSYPPTATVPVETPSASPTANAQPIVEVKESSTQINLPSALVPTSYPTTENTAVPQADADPASPVPPTDRSPRVAPASSASPPSPGSFDASTPSSAQPTNNSLPAPLDDTPTIVEPRVTNNSTSIDDARPHHASANSSTNPTTAPAGPVPAGYIGARPYYSTRPAGNAAARATPGPINLPTGPDLEGLYARGQVNGPARPTLPQRPTPTIEPKAESGFSKWSQSLSNKFSGMFQRPANEATATKAALANAAPSTATNAPTKSSTLSSQTNAARPNSGATSFATDAPTGSSGEATATKSWLERLRR